MIKNLKSTNIIVTPFFAKKEWNLNNSINSDLILTEDDEPILIEYIDYGSGTDYPRLETTYLSLEQQTSDRAKVRDGQKISGIFYLDEDPKNTDETYKRCVYSQIKNLFYNEYYDPSKTWGTNHIDFEKSKTQRFLTEYVKVVNIPQNTFGERIEKNTVNYIDNSLDVVYSIGDDGYGNLHVKDNLFSKYQSIGEFSNEFLTGSYNGCQLYFSSMATASSPTSLTASISSSYIFLKWKDNSTIPSEDGFVIERSSSLDSSFSILNYTEKNISWSLDTSVLAGNTYKYRVYAYNTFGTSSYTNISASTI